MANASVTQNINRRNVAAALREARQKCATNPRWLTAVNRAALNLEACPWQFDGDVLVIESATLAGRHTVSAHGCSCHAYANGCPCWHRAAHRLLIRAAEMQEPVASVRTALDNAAFVRLTAALNNELFN